MFLRRIFFFFIFLISGLFCITASDAFSPSGNKRPLASSSPLWNGTVVWNGASFSGVYDNTVADCSLGRVNTQYATLQSYINNIEVDPDQGQVLGTVAVQYNHGLTTQYPYQYEVFQTHVLANPDYLQFWHGSWKASTANCDISTGSCSATFPVNVKNSDAFGKKVSSSFLSPGDKRIFVILRGIDQSYGNSLFDIKKFQDAEISIDLESGFVGPDGAISATVFSNFNGHSPAGYDIRVYYTIGVYDTDYVSVTTVDVDAEDLACDGNHYCSDIQQVTLSGAVPASTIKPATIDNGDAVPMFVGLGSWGFDEKSELSEEFRRIRSGARLSSFPSVTNKEAEVKVVGEVFRDDCNLVQDGSAHWRTNELKYRVISCSDTGVCQAIYSREEGEEKAWTQKIWEAVREAFETAVETALNWITEKVADVGDVFDWVGDTITGILFPNNVAYPENEVLVVLKEGFEVEALQNPPRRSVIENVYKSYGTPKVVKEFSFEEQDAVDTHIENNILQPYDVRDTLMKAGLDVKLASDLPPLHRFYVLRFSGSDAKERDEIIEELGTAPRLQEVSANYMEKLKALPGSDLYSSSLTWLRPTIQTWWPSLPDATVLGFLVLVNPETIHVGVERLYTSSTSYALSSSSKSLEVNYFNPKLAMTHFQFPGSPPLAKNVCQSFVARAVKRPRITRSLPDLIVRDGPRTLRKIEGNFLGSSPKDKLTRSKLGRKLFEQSNRTWSGSSGEKTGEKTKEKSFSKKLRTCVQNEIIVNYKEGTSKSVRESIEKKFALIPFGHSRLTGSYYYEIKSRKTVRQVLQALQNDGSVYYAEPSMQHEMDFEPNDPDYVSGAAWHHFLNIYSSNGANNIIGINTSEAWDYGQGNNTVRVAVIDTGNTTLHPDNFSTTGDPNFYLNSLEASQYNVYGCRYDTEDFFNCYDRDGNNYEGDLYGWDFYSWTPYIEDQCGHGTAVAGLIGAVGNNGKNTAGVIHRVNILPLKVGDCELPSAGHSVRKPTLGMNTLDLAKAIEYAVYQGSKIINMSWGSYNYSSEFEKIIANASSHLFVTSAGNDGKDIDATPYYPSNYNAANIISVGASDKLGKLASWSNYGNNSVDILAPGENMVSLLMDQTSDNAGSGTSYSAALVSGTAALMYSHCPTMTPAKTKESILKTARFLPENQLIINNIILDAKEALEECLNLNDSDSNNDIDENCPNEEICQSAIQSSPDCQPVELGSGNFVYPSSCEGICTANGGAWGQSCWGQVMCFCCGSLPDCSSSSLGCSLQRNSFAPPLSVPKKSGSFFLWTLFVLVFAIRRSALRS